MIIKKWLMILIILQSNVFAAYTTSESTVATIDSYTGDLSVGSSTTITYGESSVVLTDDSDSSLTLTVTMTDDSYTSAETIAGVTGTYDPSVDGNDATGVYYVAGSQVFADTVSVYFDMEFEFSQGYTYYSIGEWVLSDADFTDLYSSADDVDCSVAKSSEIVYPLQRVDGTYISADSTTSSGYAEIRQIMIDGGSSQYKVCL